MNTPAVIAHIVEWMKQYNQKAGAQGWVIGVSGGIDSAVTSTLLAKTGLAVLCLEMPIYQAAAEISRAQKHIARLSARFDNVCALAVDLTPLFDTFVAATVATTGASESAKPSSERFLALANARARLRMTTLYYYASINHYLVAGTGNKVEDFGVGFFTKYGDGGVDLSPIAALTKTEVYQLGEELAIIEDIMVAKPTDGLWGDARNDEDQLGASYCELEWAMQHADQKPADTPGQPRCADASAPSLSARQRQVLEIYTRLHNANKHKMQAIPICLIPDNLRSDQVL